MHRLAGHPSWEVVTGFAIDDSSSAPDWRPFMPDVLSARQWIQPGQIFVSGHPGSPIVWRPGERHGLHAAALAAQR